MHTEHGHRPTPEGSQPLAGTPKATTTLKGSQGEFRVRGRSGGLPMDRPCSHAQRGGCEPRSFIRGSRPRSAVAAGRDKAATADDPTPPSPSLRSGFGGQCPNTLGNLAQRKGRRRRGHAPSKTQVTRLKYQGFKVAPVANDHSPPPSPNHPAWKFVMRA